MRKWSIISVSQEQLFRNKCKTAMNKVFKFSKCSQLFNNFRMQAQLSKASQEVWNWSKSFIILIYQFSVMTVFITEAQRNCG